MMESPYLFLLVGHFNFQTTTGYTYRHLKDNKDDDVHVTYWLE